MVVGATVVGNPVVGANEGLPGVTVGVPVLGATVLGLAVTGLALGVPGVALGPKVVGAPVVGSPVVGANEGLPGVTVGVPVVGAPVLGLAVTGLALGDPGVALGPNVVGAPVVGDPVLGLALVGANEGLPGVTVGVPVVGTLVAIPVGLTVAADGATVGPHGYKAVITRSSIPAPSSEIGLEVVVWNLSVNLLSANTLNGIVRMTLCSLSKGASASMLMPCLGVVRVQVMPPSSPERGPLSLVSSISPRSMLTVFTTTTTLSGGVQSSSWYRVNSTLTESASMGSGPPDKGMSNSLETSLFPCPNKPKN